MLKHNIHKSGIFFGGWGVSAESVEDRKLRKWGSRVVSSLVRGSPQFANE
jgi:hypothetical protein